jgi:type IV fimbrial biogenesis protein FimT
VRGPQAGFSLAEMLVAIAIGGILTALAVPNFAQMRATYRMRGATHEIFTALQRARMGAIKENNRYQFSISNSTYSVRSDVNNNGSFTTEETVTGRDIHNTASDVSLSTSATIVFAANGTAVTAGTVTLSNGYQTKTITVSLAGRVKIDS